MNKRAEIYVNKIYNSKTSGDYKILKNIGHYSDSEKMVLIEFVNTGYRAAVRLSDAIHGKVSDPCKYRCAWKYIADKLR